MTPDGWRTCPFGELFELQLGKMLNKAASETHPQYPYLGNREVQWGRFDLSQVRRMHFDEQEREKFRLRPGDLLVCEGGEVGRAALWDRDDDFYFQKALHRLRPLHHDVEPRYVLHFLRHAATRGALADFTSQSSIAHLTREKLASVPLTLPPQPEQKRIAAILSSVDDAIESTQAVIDQLDVVKKAMMAELLTRGIPGRHNRFKMTDIGEIPEGWSVKPCGDLFDIQLGKMMSEQARSGPHQLPYLRNENVRWHELDLSDVATMHFEPREREKFLLREGDLLACEGRHIGRCAVWKAELDECYYQKALHRLRSRTGELSTEYMQHFMMLRFRFMGDLVAEANSTSTIPHLPREKLLALPVWFPGPSEQEAIVAVLASLMRREAMERRVLQVLQQARSAVTTSLLTGEVRVKPDEGSAE